VGTVIASNRIGGSIQDYGIYIAAAKYTKVYRNLILDNQEYGITVDTTASNMLIANNTVFGSGGEDGILWSGVSSGTMYNNIILSNGTGAGDYEIDQSSTVLVYAALNDLYGNSAGQTNGGIIWGNGNAFSDPMLDTTSSFGITSALSPAVDTATNLPGISDIYTGMGPDMGWLESPFSMVNQGPFYVDDDSGNDGNDGRFTSPFRTIQRAANAMMPGVVSATTYVFPGTYTERVTVSSNKNPGYMVFTRLSNTRPILDGSGTTNCGIKLTNASFCLIGSFVIKAYTESGLLITGVSSNNMIWNNTLYSNDQNGIYINSDYANQNYIKLNRFYGTNQNRGINVIYADRTVIRSNCIRQQNTRGIELFTGADYSEVVRNSIYSNNIAGLYVASANQSILSNAFLGAVLGDGIYLMGATWNFIRFNRFVNQTAGIYLNGNPENNRISQNDFISNAIGVQIDTGGAQFNRIETNYMSGRGIGEGIVFGDSPNNFAESNTITRFNIGINIYGGGNNYILKNVIYSNIRYGINLDSDSADGNYILTNHVWGSGQAHGIRIMDGDGNEVRFNRIHHGQTNGIILDGSASANLVKGNDIFSNENNGIVLISWGNTVYSNDIHGLNQDAGIMLTGAGNNNRIRYNHLHNNLYEGITMPGGGQAAGNYIVHNVIASNSMYGIYIINDQADNNYILTNIIRDQGVGISLSDGDDSDINRNLIYRHNYHGIRVTGSALGTGLVNNTVVLSSVSNGIQWDNTSSGTMFNNIVLSNGNTADDYGIRNFSSGLVLADHNCSYGNYGGPTNGGNFIWGSHNTFQDPRLDTSTSCTIVSALSSAVDSGTNIPGVSDTFSGTAPDMGWKESAFTVLYEGPFYVDDDSGNDGNDGRFTAPFRTIQRAASRMIPGVNVTSATTYVFPGTYDTRVIIYSNKNPGYMVFTALSNTPPVLNGASLSNSAFWITNTTRVVIRGFVIKDYTNGIFLKNAAWTNLIIRNQIYSNSTAGIRLDFMPGGGTDYAFNSILSNSIWGRDQDYGIYNLDSDYNIIKGNRIYGNEISGVYQPGYTHYNYFLKNEIFSNDYAGIYIVSGRANCIYTNHIWGSTQDYGILIEGENNTIRSNRIIGNSRYGLSFEGYAAWNWISQNVFCSNAVAGINFHPDSIVGGTITYNRISGPGQCYGINVTNTYMWSWTIRSNLIMDNDKAGIRFHASGTNNLIHGNTFVNNRGNGLVVTSNGAYHNSIRSNIAKGQDTGFRFLDSAKNWIAGNIIAQNITNGIILSGASSNNQISLNRICSNGMYGLSISGDNAVNNIVSNNTIFGSSQDFGVYIDQADEARILGNSIRGHDQTGLYLAGSTNTLVTFNTISRSVCGIRYTNSSSGILLNTISSNTNGIRLNPAGAAMLEKNNMAGNAHFAFQFSSSVRITNNWFGTTKYTQIAGMVSNFNTPSDLIPYRLFGPFDIMAGADVDTLPRVTWVTGYVPGGNSVTLTWTKTSGADFAKYNIYQSSYPTRFSNLTYQDVVTQVNNINITNIVLSGISAGTQYFYVTAMDMPGTIYTNECWYSREAKVIVSGPASNAGPFYVDDDSGLDANPGTFSQPFRTIQRAANAMMPGVSSATTYVFPGVYREKVIVSSNKNPGFMVITKLSNELPVLNGSHLSNFAFRLTNTGRILIKNLAIQNYSNAFLLLNNARSNILSLNQVFSNEYTGIFINGGGYNTIKSNSIHNNSVGGILLDNASVDNYILNNHIYSNVSYGVVLVNGNVWGTVLLHNRIHGANQDEGVYINQSDRNTVRSNEIYMNDQNGVFLTSGTRLNMIRENNIYSNDLRGIYNWVNSSESNFFVNNDIWGANQDYGIQLQDPHYILIQSNRIFNNVTGIYVMGGTLKPYLFDNSIYNNASDGCLFSSGSGVKMKRNRVFQNQSYGVVVNGTCWSNEFLCNSIFSNLLYGIYINSESSDNNSLLTNYIFGNQGNGVEVLDSDNNLVYRNVIHHNTGTAICLRGAGTNNCIINNTVVGSVSSNGIYAADTSAGIILNNIILSNGNGDDYGIRSVSTGNVIFAYNILYGNRNDPTNGNVIWGNGNQFQNPLIETVTSFTITSSLSSAVDQGTNYFSEPFNGIGLDIGFKESLFLMAGIDTNAPNPNPAVLSVQVLSSSVIRWTAQAGSDASPPVWYQYMGSVNTNTNGAWTTVNQTSLAGLTPNTYYSQRVRMRDSSTNSNTGQWSGYAGRYTFANPPYHARLIELNEAEDVQILWELYGNPGYTEYYVERADDVNFIGNLTLIKNWSTGTNVNDYGLNYYLGYYYRIKARNRDGVETVWVVVEKPGHYSEGRKFRNNIIKSCSGEKVVYQHLFKENGNVEALIYDMTGTIVKTYQKKTGIKDQVIILEWDGRDDKGRCCAPGYYILYVKPDKARYKIIIW
ncbi:MAG: right-handed parallel beta-helix repeat-containing protein, partial [bacterium]|nr:right-handed parallel beta-helix repeat-containing protein [bacterium]